MVKRFHVQGFAAVCVLLIAAFAPAELGAMPKAQQTASAQVSAKTAAQARMEKARSLRKANAEAAARASAAATANGAINPALKAHPEDAGSQLVTAASQHLEVEVTAGEPDFYLLSFDKIPVGTTGAIQTVTLSNTSADTTVTVGNITVSDPTNFQVIPGCDAPLAPGGTCTFTVQYTPTTACAGIEESFTSLTVEDDDPNGGPIIVLTAGTSAAGGLTTTNLADTTPASALTLAQTIAGTGVNITGATFTGIANAAGTFGGGTGIIGLSNGLILSNGSIANVVGPNCSGEISGVNNQPGDTDLSTLIGQATFDATALDFDFVPTSSLVTFQYVFSSDEYQDFVFDFNDVFAFFVNGTNVALVPQTNTIVSVNNVNNGSTEPGLTGIPPVNPQFYINNDFQVPNVSPFNTEMDGMTVVLTATARVNPGVSNHIKLAIADAQDLELDSNVFVQAASLNSTNVQLSPATLAFGNLNQGGTSASQTLTVTNVGTTPLSALAVSVGEAGNFAQTNTCGTSLAAGASCTVTVTFTPKAAGVIQEHVQLSDDAADSPQNITVSGTGISGPFVTLSPFSLTFGPEAAGVTSAPQTITLTNTGTGGLTIGSIGTSDGSDFAANNNCPETTIAAGGSCTITVTWTPTAASSIPDIDQVTILDNAQNNGTQTVGLTGGVTATVGIAPGTIPFGNQAVNTTSGAQTITLTNTGSGILVVPSIVISPNFAQTNTCIGNPLNPTGTCTISVTFTPNAATAFNGTVTISDTATNSPQTVTLSGTGTAAAGSIAISPTSLTFASQTQGTTSAAQTVTVTNNGNSTVTFTNIATSGDFAGATLAQCPSIAADAAPCTFQITFTPTAAGTRTGAITFTDNATGSPQTVTLTGTGTSNAGTVTLTPASLIFPAQALNTSSAPQTVTVTNTGTATVSLTGFGATGPFAIPLGNNEGACGPETSLTAGESCTVGVIFTPTAAGPANGVFSVSDNAPGSPQTIPLTGTGQSSSLVVITVPSGGSTTATTVPGGTAFYGLLITGAPGVTGTATLGCISSSPLITCNVIPGSVVLTGGTVEVAFGVQTFCKGAPPSGGFGLPGGMGTGGGIGLLLVGLMLGGAAWTFKGNRRMAMTLAMLLLMALGSAACGGGLAKGPNGITPAGTYTLTLTATVNGQTVTLPNFLTLIVN